MEIAGAVAHPLFIGWKIPFTLSRLARRTLQKGHAGNVAKLEVEIKLFRARLQTKVEVDADGMTHLKVESGEPFPSTLNWK